MANKLIHTNYGLRWMGRAVGSGSPVSIHRVAVGVGNLVLNRDVTGLVDERYRMPPGRVYYKAGNNLQVVVEVILPVSLSQVLPREVALFDSTGSCVACGTISRATKYPDDRMRIRMFLALPVEGLVAEAGEVSADPTKIEFPLGTLNETEFLPDTWALLHDRDPDIYDLVKITGVSGTTISLAEAPARIWNKGSRITPVRVARFDSLPQVSNKTDRAAVLTARFEIQEHKTYAPVEDWGYCAPVFTFKPDWRESIDISHQRNVKILDNETGVRTYFDSGERDRVGTRAALKLFGRETVLAFRKFVAAARGKAVKFWAPSFTLDLEPTGSISGSHFDAVDIGFSDAFVKPQEARLMLAFMFADGRPTLYRRITAVVRTLTSERYFLDVPLPTIQVTELSRVNFMVPSRFDQDGFELRHHVSGSTAVSTTVVLMSVDAGDLPDINCFTTSKPYPVVSEERVSVGMVVSGGSLQEFSVPLAAVESSLSPISGALVNLLINYADEPHGLQTQLTVTGGSLV